MRNAYRILNGILKGRLRKPCRKWERNIKIDLGETKIKLVHLAQDRDQCWSVVNDVMNLRFS